MNQRWYERTVAEGRAQGELNERDFWWNWKNRRLFALSRGEEFNEPVPPHLN